MKKLKISFILIVFLMIFAGMRPNVIAKENESEEQVRHIKLEKSQLQDENIRQICRQAEYLIDDQNLVPETPEETISKENFDQMSMETWLPSYSGTNNNCYIDLKTNYKISYIAFKDTNGNNSLTFEAGTPFHWEEILTVSTDEFNTWRIFQIPEVETSFIHVKINQGTNSGISELAFYGYQTGEEPIEEPKDTSNPDFGITAENAIGMNGFIDDPLNVLDAGGFLREYHNLSWTLDKLNQNKFNQSYGGKWDFDSYYKMLKEANIVTAPCIQGASKNVYGTNQSGQFKPVYKGEDTFNPQSYKIHSSTMFQYAARYGSTKVDESKLLLASDQQKLTGLGYLTYYENWNEPDKTWEGDTGYFSPYELAAMCSSDYDGDEGRLGDTYGVKQADENAKLVMGGLCGSQNTPEYLELMNTWAKYNRNDGELPIDVINFHNYVGKVHPEASNEKEIYTAIVNWRNEKARDKEVWVTEFGWDSTESSKIGVESNEIQRDWLIRSYLIGFACGIDRQAMYMSRDASYVGDPGTYATSGLTTQKGAWTKKDSWYAVSSMKNILTGFTFDSIVEEKDNIYIYKFVNKETKEEAYALWSPTADGSYISDYEFTIGDKTKATLSKLTTGYYDAENERLKIENGIVKVDVSETPIFVTVTNSEGEYVEPSHTKIPVVKENVYTISTGKEEVDKQIQANFESLFDEQEVSPNLPKNPYKKEENGEFKTSWGDTVINQSGSVSGYIDLGENCYLSQIGIYDTYSVGDIKFYAGTPDNWEEEPFAVLKTDTYQNWKVIEAVAKTRYVKIEKLDTAKLSEMTFYGFTEKQRLEDPNQELNHKIILTSQCYQIDESKNITKILPNTTVEALKENLITNSKTMQILDKEGKEVTEGIITTEMVLQLEQGIRYWLIVTGDCNGDGLLDIVDLSILNKKILGLRDLNEKQTLAVDLNGDEEIDIVDLSIINKVILGIKTLT